MLIARRVACARSVAPSRRLFVPHRPFFFGRSGEGDESSPKESGASASSVVVDTPDDSDNVTPLGVGDQAPKVPRVLALALEQRPIMPGMVQTLHLRSPAVIDTLSKMQESGPAYVGLFLRKRGRDDDAAAEGEVGSASDTGELITSLDEVHTTGAFAQLHQIVRPPRTQLDDRGEVASVPAGGGGDGGSALGGDGGGAHALLLVHRRCDALSIVESGPPPFVEVEHWGAPVTEEPFSDVMRAHVNEIVGVIRELVRVNPLFKEQMAFFTQRVDVSEPHKLADFAAAMTTADGRELQAVLAAKTLEERLKLTLALLIKERELSKLQAQISQQVEEKISKQQRQYFLHEQLKSIKKELGMESDDKDALISKYRERLDRELPAKGGTVPEKARAAIDDELNKLGALERNSAEFNVTRTYLDWLTALPWGVSTRETFELGAAREVLDADHHGLEDVKERILEFVAIAKLTGSSVRGKILCLVGPPGVGKTSIGRSIAGALGREFYRFSVGGLTDVAEIKGHRRTYVGAMPGKPIQCLRSTGVENPLILIDEVDKIGRGHQGDPASALLELLDPGQNSAFTDHYLDVPVDLSSALFVCTANVAEQIPGPLLDRMELVRLSGYDLPEKVAIASQYLVPKAREAAGILEGAEGVPSALAIEENAIEALARWYCREAGVRNLEKHIERVCRKLALKLVKQHEAADGGGDAPDPADEACWRVTAERLPDLVGKPVFTSDRLYGGDEADVGATAARDAPRAPAGVVLGLAWTALGGSSLYIESVVVPRRNAGAEGGGEPDARGGGRLQTTGQMGGVMEESTRIAHTHARRALSAHAATLVARGRAPECAEAACAAAATDGAAFFSASEIHLHVPEGATPKDGPSAGVTMCTALISLATGVPVRADVAMTGELSLTGRVLPVGGIKEKTIAARRAGAKRLVFPAANQRDYDELPAYLTEGLDVRFAASYDDVFEAAFDLEPPP